jgi:hypothetical protein
MAAGPGRLGRWAEPAGQGLGPKAAQALFRGLSILDFLFPIEIPEIRVNFKNT